MVYDHNIVMKLEVNLISNAGKNSSEFLEAVCEFGARL